MLDKHPFSLLYTLLLHTQTLSDIYIYISIHTQTLSPAGVESEQRHRQNCLSPITPHTAGNDLSDLAATERERQRKRRTDGGRKRNQRQVAAGEGANRDAGEEETGRRLEADG